MIKYVIEELGNDSSLTWNPYPQQTGFDTMHQAMVALCELGAHWDNFNRCWRSNTDPTKTYRIKIKYVPMYTL